MLTPSRSQEHPPCPLRNVYLSRYHLVRHKWSCTQKISFLASKKSCVSSMSFKEAKWSCIGKISSLGIIAIAFICLDQVLLMRCLFSTALDNSAIRYCWREKLSWWWILLSSGSSPIRRKIEDIGALFDKWRTHGLSGALLEDWGDYFQA